MRQLWYCSSLLLITNGRWSIRWAMLGHMVSCNWGSGVLACLSRRWGQQGAPRQGRQRGKRVVWLPNKSSEQIDLNCLCFQKSPCSCPWCVIGQWLGVGVGTLTSACPLAAAGWEPTVQWVSSVRVLFAWLNPSSLAMGTSTTRKISLERLVLLASPWWEVRELKAKASW